MEFKAKKVSNLKVHLIFDISIINNKSFNINLFRYLIIKKWNDSNKLSTSKYVFLSNII